MRQLRQISLVSIFYLVTLCALLLALLAPFVRAMNGDSRKSFLISGTVQWVLFVLAVAWTLRKRSRIQRNSGKLIYQAELYADGNSSLPTAFVELGSLVFVVIYELVLAVAPAILLHPFFFILQLMALDVGARAFLSLLLGVKQHFEIYEQGYTLTPVKLQSWDDVKAVQPVAHSGDKIALTFGQDSQQGDVVKTLRIEASRRDEICKQIAELLKRANVVDGKTSPDSTEDAAFAG